MPTDPASPIDIPAVCSCCGCGVDCDSTVKSPCCPDCLFESPPLDVFLRLPPEKQDAIMHHFFELMLSLLERVQAGLEKEDFSEFLIPERRQTVLGPPLPPPSPEAALLSKPGPE